MKCCDTVGACIGCFKSEGLASGNSNFHRTKLHEREFFQNEGNPARQFFQHAVGALSVKVDNVAGIVCGTLCCHLDIFTVQILIYGRWNCAQTFDLLWCLPFFPSFERLFICAFSVGNCWRFTC